MKTHLAIAAAPLALLAACGVAWAQEAGAVHSGIADVGGGAGAVAALVVIGREGLSWLRSRDAAREAKESEAALSRGLDAIRAEIRTVDGRVSGMSDRVTRLEVRVDAVDRRAGEVHADLSGIREGLDGIRDRLATVARQAP